MTLDEVMSEMKRLGSAQTKKTMLRHGAREPLDGVKVGDLKTIHKKIGGNQALAMELFATGHSEAQYLAGMVADGRQMTREQIQKWLETASWSMISNNTVVWVAAEHPDGLALGLEWIESAEEKVAAAGWNVLSALTATVPDSALPVKEFARLLDRIGRTLKAAPNEVKYTMNGFVISCGTYVAELAEKAVLTARKLGRVEVDMGNTACLVPEAEPYIMKSRRGAAVAPKRKTVRC